MTVLWPNDIFTFLFYPIISNSIPNWSIMPSHYCGDMVMNQRLNVFYSLSNLPLVISGYRQIILSIQTEVMSLAGLGTLPYIKYLISSISYEVFISNIKYPISSIRYPSIWYHILDIKYQISSFIYQLSGILY